MPAKKKSKASKAKKTKKSSKKKAVTSSAKKKSAGGTKSSKSTKKAAPAKSAAKKAVKKASKNATKKASKKAAAKTGGNKPAAPPVFLINMIPRALSGETHQDSEPHLTVNPSNPKQIVATAFTPDPGGGVNAPIFLSVDNGLTWMINSIVPSAAGSATHDITTGLSGTSKKLYSGILRAPTSNLEFLRTTDFAAPVPMTVLASRPNADQPFTHATTVQSGPDAGKERVYIGSNDFAGPSGHTATIDHSLNAGISSPTFKTVRIETRTTVGQGGA